MSMQGGAHELRERPQVHVLHRLLIRHGGHTVRRGWPGPTNWKP